MQETISMMLMDSGDVDGTTASIRITYGSYDRLFNFTNSEFAELVYQFNKMSKDRNILSMITPSMCVLYFDPKDARRAKQGVQEIFGCLGVSIKL